MDLIIKILTAVLLSFIAITVGIEAGNILHRLDTEIVEKVDTENFKDTINSSLPIIETVYNSGKVSISLSREVKSLFGKIFDFDLTSPITILNVQSPLFRSYYNKEYHPNIVMNGDNKKSNMDETGYTGDNGVIEKGGEDTGEKIEPGSDKGNDDGQDGSEATTPEPISSIAYENEEEEDDKDGDIVEINEMVIRNFTKHNIDISKLLKEPIDFNFNKKGPKVLIYHTHTSESYVLKEEDLGKKDVPSFNTNPKYNVVRVGEELAKNLKKHGIETLHNATVHDKNRTAAYGVAAGTLQSYLKSYPSIKVYIDIHRDGIKDSKYRPVAKINGKNAAQIMFVMGTDDQLPNDHWQENLKFALKVQQKLNEKYPGLARPLWIVGKRYNQHVSNQAVLIEVGGDGNLLSESLESVKYLAEALSEVINDD